LTKKLAMILTCFFRLGRRWSKKSGKVNYCIVGPNAIDHTHQYIDLDSPLAQALMRKQVDDEVAIILGVILSSIGF
jgi:hypothetical protein